jgi:hypothetical protein
MYMDKTEAWLVVDRLANGEPSDRVKLASERDTEIYALARVLMDIQEQLQETLYNLRRV